MEFLCRFIQAGVLNCLIVEDYWILEPAMEDDPGRMFHRDAIPNPQS